MKKQLLSLGVLLFVGVILIPMSVIYCKTAVPFMVVASCIAGIIAYLFIENRTKTIVNQMTLADGLNSSLHEISKQLSILNDAFSASRKNEESNKEEVLKSIQEMTDAIKNAINEHSSVLKASKDDILAKLSEQNTKALTEISTLASNINNNHEVVVTSLEQIKNIYGEVRTIGQQSVEELKLQNENIRHISASFHSDIELLHQQQKLIVSSLVNNHEVVENSLHQITGIFEEVKTTGLQSAEELKQQSEQMAHISVILHDDIELLRLHQETIGSSIDTNHKALTNYLSQIPGIFGDVKTIGLQGIEELKQQREQMNQISATVHDDILELRQQQEKVSSATNSMETVVTKSMKYLEESHSIVVETSNDLSSSIKQFLSGNEERYNIAISSSRDLSSSVNKLLSEYEATFNYTIESAKDLSSSIKKFLSEHEDIQKSLNSTADNLLALQSNLEELFGNQSSLIGDVLTKFTDNLNSNVSKIKRSFDDSTEELKDSLKNSVEKVEDQQVDLIDKLESFSSNITKYMHELEEGIMMHDDKLSMLNSYIPKLQELNLSEEKMMKELEKICRMKR